MKNCKECKNNVADKELYVGKCKVTGRTTMMNDTCGCYEKRKGRKMKLNDLYDIIADGWEYTILFTIRGTATERCYKAVLCRGLRKGDEDQAYVRLMKNLDLNVNKIYGGSDDAGIIIETEPGFVRKS